MLDPNYTWQPTTCGMCGQPIIYVGPYWDHTGENKPRHPAVPAAEWEQIKAEQPAPVDCKHHGALFIASETSTGDVNYRKHASICPHCGEIIVWINGERMTFALVSDAQVQAAGLYAEHLRSSTAEPTREELLALLRQCRPWLPHVERELREVVARALGEDEI